MADKKSIPALKVIQDFQAEVTPIVEEYAKDDKSSLAVASALLGTLVPLYKDVFGTERTAVMMYKVADDLAKTLKKNSDSVYTKSSESTDDDKKEI